MKTIIGTISGASIERMISKAGVFASMTSEVAHAEATMRPNDVNSQLRPHVGAAPEHHIGPVPQHVRDATGCGENCRVSGVFVYSPRL